MPRSKKKFEEIREERQQQIMEISLKLFAERGYSSVSIAELANAAGISKGLLYNYFISKEALLKEIVDQQINTFLNWLDPNHDWMLDNNEIKNYIKLLFANISENPEKWKNIMQLANQPDVVLLIHGKIDEITQPVMKMMYNYFKNKNHKDPEVEIAVFSSILSGVIQKYVYSPQYFPLDKIEKRILEIFNIN